MFSLFVQRNSRVANSHPFYLCTFLTDLNAGTQRLRALCAVGEESDDGVFWMSFADFAQKFASVFVCRMTARAPVSLRCALRRESIVALQRVTHDNQIAHLSTQHTSTKTISIC